MREIKFRAWNGYKFSFCTLSALGYLDWGNEKAKLPSGFKYEIMQYTGMHDCNNIEIYEGDIVEFEDDMLNIKRQEIIFDCGTFCTYNTFTGGKNELYDFNFYIIGNVYENPELLEEDNEN